MENGHGRDSYWETTVSGWALMVALARVVGVGYQNDVSQGGFEVSK